MSVKSNTMVQDVATRSIFPNARQLIDATISFTQGDMLWLDTATHLIKKMTLETQSATALGIAPVTIVSGKYPSAYNTDVDASVGIPAIPGPQYGSTFSVVLKAGDAITPGQKVYFEPGGAAGAPAVTVTAGTAAVGVYQGKALTAPAGGAVIEILVAQNFQVGV